MRSTALGLLLALAVVPHPAGAVDLGLTPSHVFGLWTNVNTCLQAIAKDSDNGSDLSRQVDALAPASFANKTPADVLQRVGDARSVIDALRRDSGLPPVNTYEHNSGGVTPSVVYLNSGYILDGLADWLARDANSQLLVTTCYESTSFSNKTPSDVLGLVDLAVRRITLINQAN